MGSFYLGFRLKSERGALSADEKAGRRLQGLLRKLLICALFIMLMKLVFLLVGRLEHGNEAKVKVKTS